MTFKQVYEATAIELSKIQAPALKLYEFNYFANQAIRQFVNKVYNVYDINQQTTDDLRVLKATATLLPVIAPSTGNKALDYLRGATYYVDMPDDYLHLLNCVCLFNVNKPKECWDKGDVMVVGATKLTADSWSSVVDDVYNQPTKKRPYYYIHNQNDIHVDSEGVLSTRNSQMPSNYETDEIHNINVEYGNAGTDETPELTNESGFSRTFEYFEDEDSSVSTSMDAVEKPTGSRHANSSRVKVEIRCGNS